MNFKCKLSNYSLGCLIDKFMEINCINSKNIAVALNENLIKKSEWNKTKISENDRIEIVVPFAGG